MDKQSNTELTTKLQQHWSQIEPQIIQKYSGVQQADLQGYTDFNDLLERVSQKAGQPVNEIESEFRQLVETASGSGSSSR